VVLSSMVDTQAFCGDSLMAASDSAGVSNRSNFTGELTERLDNLQPHHHQQQHGGRRHQQQQQQRSTSSPGCDNPPCTQQRRSSSQDCDVDLSPTDADDNDFIQVPVHNSLLLLEIFAYLYAQRRI